MLGWRGHRQPAVDAGAVAKPMSVKCSAQWRAEVKAHFAEQISEMHQDKEERI
jgi:hypothetical protein